MAGVNAKFQADFTDFFSAINQAQLELVDFGKGANKVEGTLNRMIDSFSGRKLIQEASLMTIAIEKAGGISTLTARELDALGQKVASAADKMLRLGQEVPEGMARLVVSIDETQKAARLATEDLDQFGVQVVKIPPGMEGATRSTNSWRGALSQFDGVLASVGINIGSEIRAIDEMSAAAGKSATEIGVLGTAGLALGAGFAGWKVGRMIAEFTGLDQVVEDAARQLFGFGDIAIEVAGAKLETVTRAIIAGADANITYADAVKFLIEKHKEHGGVLDEYFKKQKALEEETNKYIAEMEHWDAIMAELNTVGVTWQATLDGINGEVVEAIKFYLEAGVSQNTLAQAYGLTATQIRAVSQAMKEEEAAAKSLAEFRAAADKRQTEISYALASAKNAETVAQLQLNQANAAFLQTELDAALAADKAMFGSGGGISSEIHGNQRGPAINSTGAVIGSAGAAGFHLAPHPLRAGGGSVSAGQGYIVGERGPELFTPGANGFVTPNGGGGTVNNFYVNGTAEESARQIMAILTRNMKSSTKVKVTQ